MTAVVLEQQRSAARLKVHEDISSIFPSGYCRKCNRADDGIFAGNTWLYEIAKLGYGDLPLRLSSQPLRQVLKNCLRAANSRVSMLLKCCSITLAHEEGGSARVSRKAIEIYTAAGLCLSCLQNGEQPTYSCKHGEDKAMAGPLE